MQVDLWGSETICQRWRLGPLHYVSLFRWTVRSLERWQTQVVDSWIREGDVRVVPWCSSTSDTRLKGDKYEGVSDDTRVKMYTPVG